MPVKRRRLTDAEKTRIRIHRCFNCSAQTVYQHLRRHGIPLRRPATSAAVSRIMTEYHARRREET